MKWDILARLEFFYGNSYEPYWLSNANIWKVIRTKVQKNETAWILHLEKLNNILNFIQNHIKMIMISYGFIQIFSNKK